MLEELKALCGRYRLTYFRYPGKFFRDFLITFIMGGLLALRRAWLLGAFGVWVFMFLTPITFLMTARSMLGEIVEEKSTGIKEYLKLNGVGTLTYQFYLKTITSAKTVIFSLIIILGYLVGYIIPESMNFSRDMTDVNILEALQLYILAALGTASFILCLSTFFSDAKLASSVGGLIYMVLSVVSLVIAGKDDPVVTIIFGLFPQGALFGGLVKLTYGSGYNSVTLIKLVLIFDWILYSLLYTYLDQVMSDEHGVSKPMFFCCQRKKQRKAVKVQENSDMGLSANLINQEDGENSSREEDWSSAVFHEELRGAHNLKRTVQINHLIKTFNKKMTAVDDVSFSIYAGQIFCLLGHNGAGKTTTIKMLTGMLELDSGDIAYDGDDFLSNMEEVRKKIGICTQNDILFEKLTVREHLELIAKLRNIPFFDISEAVDKAISSLNLQSESIKYSEELSGGNKRKLSLAMAILGQTKVIFLDEPTSGMDPQNRRVIWHHLRLLKEQGMTILLTTHHLDEADELADRVAIMSKGKLLALGTCEYFKKNFGVGYHLNITPMYEKLDVNEFCAQKPELQKMVTGIIPQAQFDEQTANDVLKCSLPFITQKDFPKLFAELEANENLRISVEMNTLEDVYVNIGLSEERLLHGRTSEVEVNIHPQAPECLKEPVVHSFSAQVLAIAKRRALLLARSKKNLLLVLLPFILIVLSFGFAFFLSLQGQYEVRSGLWFFAYACFFAFTLNTGAYCSLPVYEREEKLKYMMDVMGLRNLAYWIGNLSVDFLVMTFINLTVAGLYASMYYQFYIYDTEYIHLNVPSPFTVIMFLVPHGLALITIGYVFSFMFDKSLSAIKFFPMFYFFGLFLVSTYIIFAIFSQQWQSNPENITPLSLRIAALVGGFFCPSTLLVIAFVGYSDGGFLGALFPSWACALALLVNGLIYLWIAIALESRRLSASTKSRTTGWSAPETQVIPIDQNDIETEKNRTEQATEEPIKVLDMSKVYDNGYAAVKHITFGVAPGQIFGLLGPNGAGKSTSFNILTAASAKSAGSVQLLGQEINRNLPEVFENVGICPQFDALWDILTVKEHLTLYGQLKGLAGSNLHDVVNYYIDVLQLRDHANKRAHELSGGNKRKLMVANAFIGSASLIFLDEPSTGVDPLARRFLWNSIQQVLKMRQASVVLTTHSMYEAESLSHKIGILINGRFVCIGPTQYLKDKYSHGYKITVSLRPEADDPMPKILESFQGATRVHESSHIQQTYHVPFEGFKFSEAFAKLESLKSQGFIKDFSLYNTTLEQIFIYFSRFQINADPSSSS